MRRRDFITAIGGVATAWPLAAHAQQAQVRRIDVLMNVGESDAEGQARLTAFVQRLRELGCTHGRNVQLDVRWSAGNDESYRHYAN